MSQHPSILCRKFGWHRWQSVAVSYKQWTEGDEARSETSDKRTCLVCGATIEKFESTTKRTTIKYPEEKTDA